MLYMIYHLAFKGRRPGFVSKIGLKGPCVCEIRFSEALKPFQEVFEKLQPYFDAKKTCIGTIFAQGGGPKRSSNRGL